MNRTRFITRFLAVFLTASLSFPGWVDALRPVGLEESGSRELLIERLRGVGLEEPESPRLPSRMHDLLFRMTELERLTLLHLMNGSTQKRVGDQLQGFWRILEQTEAFRRLEKREQDHLYQEIGRPTNGGFTDEEALLNLLRLFVAGQEVQGWVSAESPIFFNSHMVAGLPLPECLVLLQLYGRLLPAAVQPEIEDLYRRGVLQNALIVRARELKQIRQEIARFIGPPDVPRTYAMNEIAEAFPAWNLKVFLRQNPTSVPLAISSKVTDGQPLRFSEMQQVVDLSRKTQNASLPESLRPYRKSLQERPLPRLTRHLPDLQDPNALWDPFQIQLLQTYAQAEILSLLERSGEKMTKQPTWVQDAGGQNGLSDFPEPLQRRLRDAKTFAQRVFAISGYLDWKDTQLALIAGVRERFLEHWRREGFEEPWPQFIPRFAAALRAHPIFLLTGQSVHEALREGPPSRRANLLFHAQGLTQVEAAAVLGISQVTVQETLKRKKWNRETIFQWAEELLDVDPTLLEFGRPAPVHKSLPPRGDFGFARKTKGADAAYAARLHKRLLQAMKLLRGESVVSEWRTHFGPAPGYRGVVGQMAAAFPATVDRMVEFGFPADIAGRLQSSDSLTSEEVDRLARYLIEAYEGLEDLFVSAPQYHPGKKGGRGYGNRSQHVFDTWQLVARGITAERLLSIANQARVTLAQLKAKILIHPDPEGEIATREEILRKLLPQFSPSAEDQPIFSPAAIRNYAWASANPAQVLEEARGHFKELLDMGSRGWILAQDRRGTVMVSRTLAKLKVSHPGNAKSLLAQLRNRIAAIQEGLRTFPETARLRGISETLQPSVLKLYPIEGQDAPRDLLAAMDLLNRVVAYRQLEDPDFFKEPTSVQVQGLIRRMTASLDAAQAAGRLPGRPEELEPFLQELAAGLEEIRVLSIEQFQRRFRGVDGPPGARQVVLVSANAQMEIQLYADPTLLGGLEERVAQEKGSLPEGMRVEVRQVPSTQENLEREIAKRGKLGAIFWHWLVGPLYEQYLLPEAVLDNARPMPRLISLVLCALQGVGAGLEEVKEELVLQEAQNDRYRAYFV